MKTLLLLIGATIMVAFSGCKSKDDIRLSGCVDALTAEVTEHYGPVAASMVKEKIVETCRKDLGL